MTIGEPEESSPSSGGIRLPTGGRREGAGRAAFSFNALFWMTKAALKPKIIIATATETKATGFLIA